MGQKRTLFFILERSASASLDLINGLKVEVKRMREVTHLVLLLHMKRL